jgi:hypothetical protein
MAFQSLDHLIQKMSGGNHFRYDFGFHTGTSGFTASRWYDLSRGHRSGANNTYPGTASAWVTCDESTGNGTGVFGILHGGNKTPATKHVINTGAFSGPATSGGTGTLLLVDMQGYWPGVALNSASSQALSGTPTLRYTNGEGCRLYLATTTAPTTGTPSVSISYTNQTGTPGQSLGATVNLTASAIQQHILHTGIAAGNYGPFLPLADGDYGVQNVASVQLSGAMGGSGVAALVLARPILSIPLTVGSVMVDRDLLTGTPGLPLIKDGACLTWLYYSTAATAGSTTFTGYIDFAWA